MNASEYAVPPARILLHHPAHGKALDRITLDTLDVINFLETPDTSKLYMEYDTFVSTLKSKRVRVTFLQELLSGKEDFAYEATTNPNLMFVRDSAVTLPWAPSFFIPSRLTLASRSDESDLMRKALERLGLQSLIDFTDDEFLEGGDVLPIQHQGRRILIIGFGARTTQAAAVAIARKLIPEYVDQIIGLKHDPDLLHLDTGFTVLPDNVIFAAGGMFHDGFIIDEDKRLNTIDPIQYAEDSGFTIIRTSKQEAIDNERCNLLPLGERQYVAFDMPPELRQALEQASSINITVMPGQEIAKATGGVHCLSRPVYM